MPCKGNIKINRETNIKKDLEESSQYLIEELKLKRKPVGIKILYSKEEYEKFPFEESTYKMSYCVYVEKATRGMALKHSLKNHYCDGATTAFNLEYPSDRIESGEEYFSYGLYKTRAAAKRLRDGVQGIYRQNIEVYGIATGPLESFEEAPDIVILICNPYQIMRIEQGAVYKTGERLHFSSAAMQGICSEVTVEPYLTGRINISTLCPSTRHLAKWREEDMAVGIPYELLDDIIIGIENIKYNTEQQ